MKNSICVIFWELQRYEVITQITEITRRNKCFQMSILELYVSECNSLKQQDMHHNKISKYFITLVFFVRAIS